MNKKRFGFLRETKVEAEKFGVDKETGLNATGLDEYLEEIFPNTNDWVHDKEIPNIYFDGKKYKCRPDYRSEKIKMIIEFDGLPHYQNPDVILKDTEKDVIYAQYGYKVIRIPYFIQLTNEIIEKIFEVEVNKEMFPENIACLDIKYRNTPAYLCPLGIRRMAIDFKRLSLRQYELNIEHLKKQDDYYDFLTGTKLLIDEMRTIR